MKFSNWDCVLLAVSVFGITSIPPLPLVLSFPDVCMLVDLGIFSLVLSLPCILRLKSRVEEEVIGL